MKIDFFFIYKKVIKTDKCEKGWTIAMSKKIGFKKKERKTMSAKYGRKK